MWIFTSVGMVSIVSDYEKEGNLLVRARAKKHLALLFPKEKIETTPLRDYRFRVSVPKAQAAKLMTDMVNDIDYHNFKDSIEDDVYHDACSDIWGVMFHYQRGQK